MTATERQLAEATEAIKAGCTPDEIRCIVLAVRRHGHEFTARMNARVAQGVTRYGFARAAFTIAAELLGQKVTQ